MSFNAELFMWFKWTNTKIDPNDFCFLNGITNTINKIEILKENLSKTIKYRCYRIIWNYSTDFDLKEFPFDYQFLNITVSHKNLNSGHLLLALDSRHMATETIQNIPEDWEYLGKEINSGLHQYDSTFGDPDYRLGKGYKSKIYFATTSVDIELKRRVTSYIFTFFAPLGIIILITILIFGIPIEDLSTRLSVAMTSLLSILVFQMTQRQSMPMVGYAMKSDYYFIVSYIFLFSLISCLLIANILWKREKTQLAKLVDKLYICFGLPVVIIAYSVITYY